MLLYHYTSARHLRGIARYGLTVGDVPTDILREKGRVGVWLTSSLNSAGHGLEGAAADKTAYRLAVEVPDNSRALVRWLDWAPANVTPHTLDVLHRVAAEHGGDGPASWFVFFGVIPPGAILTCTDTRTGGAIADWGEFSPVALDIKAVPPWRREAWQRNMMKQVNKELRRRAARR